MYAERHAERGAAAVEFALVLSILLALLMGVIEFGRVWAIQANLAQASREAAREMAIKDDETLARQHFYQSFLPFGESDADAAKATVTFSKVTGLPNDACQHTASAEYTAKSWTGFFVSEYTLTGEGAMRCGG
ncbi:TadE/TadG family type IV pilus assembly protein [Ornithinimicrobium pekingense]|nr:TadE/TadG family type IV pilus assembly protein [Ornithinimicrobium pekingense]